MSIVCHGQKSDRFSVHVSSTVYGLSILHREVLFLQEEFSKAIIAYRPKCQLAWQIIFYKVGVVSVVARSHSVFSNIMTVEVKLH